MNRLTCALFLLFPIGASASTISFQGLLTADDQHPAIYFTANSTETITIQSYGYAGGAVNSSVVPEGGFDPGAFVFDSLGNLYAQYDGTSCVTGNDSVTGNCDDPFIQQLFAAGQYELVLVVNQNFPNGASLADGFVEDGAGSYTCAPFSESGNFCDVSTALGTPRTGNWAVAITGADSVSLPEPGGFSLMGIAGAVALFMRRRRRA